MKIKVVSKPYSEVRSLPRPAHLPPRPQSPLMRGVMRVLSGRDLKKVHFAFTEDGLDGIDRRKPCLYLMNHSCFLDLEIAAKLIGAHPYYIVCTSDGFVGKRALMRSLGCVPTRKFQTDLALVRDLDDIVRVLHGSVLMYPEASYSFDGTATPLPEGLGKLVKRLGIPVVMIRTHGAFLRDPLYNGLRLRKVDVSARMYGLLTREQTQSLSAEEVSGILREAFTFDNFREQMENDICVDEPFRAEGLERVLYKCPHCLAEGKMRSRGAGVRCEACGKSYELTETGRMRAEEGETEYPHIPDWYAWERSCIREELEQGTYRLEVPVTIRMMVDYKAIYEVGEGVLVHTPEGFHLTGCGGELDFRQKPLASYSLYSDYYWYELGDMICIGDKDALYYCFPQGEGPIVAKTRLAAEELYKRKRAELVRERGRRGNKTDDKRENTQ